MAISLLKIALHLVTIEIINPESIKPIINKTTPANFERPTIARGDNSFKNNS